MAGTTSNFRRAVLQALDTSYWDDTGTAGSGQIQIGASPYRQFGICVAASDEGTALTSGWYSGIFGQCLLTANPGASVSTFGVTGELHVGVTVTTGDNHAGVYGYMEIGTGFTWTKADNISLSAILAGVDIPSGAIIGTGSVASAIAVGCNLGGTHTGKFAVLHVKNGSAGAYDCFLQLGWNHSGGDSTGLTASASGVTTIAKGLKCYVADTLYYIPLCTGTT